MTLHRHVSFSVKTSEGLVQAPVIAISPSISIDHACPLYWWMVDHGWVLLAFHDTSRPFWTWIWFKDVNIGHFNCSNIFPKVISSINHQVTKYPFFNFSVGDHLPNQQILRMPIFGGELSSISLSGRVYVQGDAPYVSCFIHPINHSLFIRNPYRTPGFPRFRDIFP